MTVDCIQKDLQVRNVVSLRSKLAGKYLRVIEKGMLDCGGDAGTASEWTTVQNYVILSNLGHVIS